MKKIFIVLAVLFLELNVFAQYDEQFYYPKKEWISSDFPVHEDIYFYPEQDTLHTVFYKPDGTPEATILYLHGNSGNISYYAPYITTLVKAGYQVITVDFRGYGKSSGHPTHQNIAADGQMILDSLLHRDDIKNTKLILYGASIGTQLATKLAKDNQDKINALVLEGGMSSCRYRFTVYTGRTAGNGKTLSGISLFRRHRYPLHHPYPQTHHPQSRRRSRSLCTRRTSISGRTGTQNISLRPGQTSESFINGTGSDFRTNQ